ncbi:hypothetical protein MKW92_029037 [Papaver armeniacum]|nr:hypothetical protein MKW92_029037 [Papaver armeniacum]
MGRPRMWNEKARVEDGYEVLNTKFVEVEKQLEDCKCKCHCLSMELKEKKMERVGPEGELKNLMLTNVGMIGSPNNPLGSSPSSLQGNFEDARVAGTPHLDYQCELSEGIKDEKNNICFDSMVDYVIADREQLGVETNESSRETLVLLKQGDIRTSSTCIIEISDDEVMEICDSEEDGM